MIKLKVSTEEALELLETIQTPTDFQNAIKNYFLCDNAGCLTEKSFYWLYCWAYNVPNIREVWNKIIPIAYEYFNENSFYPKASKQRYK